MAKSKKKMKWDFGWGHDKALEIAGPKGMRIWVDYDDVDHDAADELADWLISALNERDS